MKKIITIIFLIQGIILYGQQIKKPSYVIIANNKIITKERLEEYASLGLVKGMHKGVNEQEFKKLVAKFGDKIGDKEFVMKIDLFTKEEKSKHQNKTTSTNKEPILKKNTDTELKINLNDIAPDFTVQMINGEKITLSDLKGKVVLVNYWATWCTPCIMEFTEIPEKILNPFSNKDVVFIPISIGESKEIIQQKMSKIKKYGIDFNVGIDPNKEIWNKYATGAIPKNFIIDQKGIVRHVSIGNADESVDKLAVEIKKILKK